jgi:GNAT superfamily N-acetyltransferase
MLTVEGMSSQEMNVTICLVQPKSEDDWRQARRLIEQYAASLDVDLSFQNFANELQHLEEKYAPPAGAILLAEEGGIYFGCVGLRYFAEGVGEIKRLYATPAARGRRVGRLLAEGIVDMARRAGYVRLLLDTLPSMKEAQALYASMGFKPTAAYRFNPVPGTAFLELTL